MTKLFFALLIPLAFSQPSFAAFDAKGTNCTFEKFMKNFIKGEVDSPRHNTFAVSKVHNIEDTKAGEYWVHWVEKRTLLLVSWPATKGACKTPKLVMRRRLELNKDVVATAEDAAGSTFLVTQDWAKEVLYSAARDGQTFHVVQ